MYDGVLQIQLPRGAALNALALVDDLSLVVGHPITSSLKRITREDWLEAVRQWQWYGCPPSNQVESLRENPNRKTDIENTIKYLGVILEFNPRCSILTTMAVKAATRTKMAVAGLMPNIGGPGEDRRQLLAKVSRAKLIYAAPASALERLETWRS